jgi:hypothetical protein
MHFPSLLSASSFFNLVFNEKKKVSMKKNYIYLKKTFKLIGKKMNLGFGGKGRVSCFWVGTILPILFGYPLPDLFNSRITLRSRFSYSLNKAANPLSQSWAYIRE